MKRLFKKVTALVLGLLTIAGLAGLNSNSVEPVVKAEAATITAGTVIYLKPGSTWESDNPRYAVYCCEGDGEKWYSLSELGDTGIYAATISQKQGKLIFCRMDPNTYDNNWNNKWNQTGDLTWNGSKNLCTLSGNIDYPDCNWSEYKNETSIFQDQAIYLKPNSNWTQANARFAVYFYTNSGSSEWVDMKKTSEDGIYVTYAPKEYSHFIFCRMNPSITTNNWDNKWNQSEDLTLITGYNLFHNYSGSWDFLGGDWSFYLTSECKSLMEGLKTTNTCTETKETISDDAAIALYIEEVNGLRELFDGLCADEQKYIQNTKLDDNTTYYERLTFLETKKATFETVTASGANLLSNITSSNNILIVLIVGLLGLTTVGAYYFLNKKKYAK